MNKHLKLNLYFGITHRERPQNILESIYLLMKFI